MNAFGSQAASLWNDDDGFFYDVVVGPDGAASPLRVRSLVGLVPLLAATEIPRSLADENPDATSRFLWLQRRRPDLVRPLIAGTAGRDDLLLTLVDPERLRRILQRLFDPDEFLSPFGIRSLSAAYRGGAIIEAVGEEACIDYEPGESTTALFGGNSNWRGPVWFPLNVLLADSAADVRPLLRRLADRRGADRFGPPRHAGAGGRRHRRARWCRCSGGSTACVPPTGSASRPAARRCGASTRRSASTSTATPAKASAPRTRRAGPRSSPTCSTRGCPGSHAATADQRAERRASPTIDGMEQDPLVWIAALRSGHDSLAEFVAGASADDLARRSMATEWSVAQVLSHLGSGAEIGLAGRTGEAIENEAVWARWNAKRPDDMASSFVEADEALVSWWESQHARRAGRHAGAAAVPSCSDRRGRSDRLPVVGGRPPRLGRAGDVRRRRHPRPPTPPRSWSTASR